MENKIKGGRKMKRCISKLLVMCICVTMLSVSSMQVNASESQKALGGVAISESDSSEIIKYSTLKGMHLWYGTAYIAQKSATVITAGGTTVARSTLPSIAISIRVEYYQNGAWHYYYGWGATAYNTNYISSYRDIYAVGGKYYCVRTYHTGGGEGIDNSSSGIWIG